MDAPPIRYVKTADGVRIAYAVTGSGPPLLVLRPPIGLHLQHDHRLRFVRELVASLGLHHSVIRFDVRGFGLSEQDVSDLSLEAEVLDARAVLEREGVTEYDCLAWELGTPLAITLAADSNFPVRKLVLIYPFPSFREYFATPASQALASLGRLDAEMMFESWGATSGGWGRADADDLRDYLRLAYAPRASSHWGAANHELEVRSLLPQIAIPALVLSSSAYRLVPLSMSREVAALLPRAEFVVDDGLYDWDRWAPIVESFLAAATPEERAAGGPSSFRTILFTDLEGHTAMMSRLGDAKGREVLREHERLTRQCLREHGGTEVKTMGDGFMASFASAQKALECAIALQQALSAENSALAGLRVRCGVNAGEPIAEDDDLFGASVIAAARIAAKATGGQVLVANVVRELVAGKGFLFSGHGRACAQGHGRSRARLGAALV